MRTQNRVLTAVTIDKGVITLIDESGEIKNYLQRGIEALSMREKAELGKQGLLDFDGALSFKDLPKDISIVFEEPSIMGRAYVTYSVKREKELLKKSKEKK